MAAEYAVEYCSFTAKVMGIKFYTGLGKLHSMMNVRVKREFGNVHDANAALVWWNTWPPGEKICKCIGSNHGLPLTWSSHKSISSYLPLSSIKILELELLLLLAPVLYSGEEVSVNQSRSYQYRATDVLISLCIPKESEIRLQKLLELHSSPEVKFEVSYKNCVRKLIRISLYLSSCTE